VWRHQKTTVCTSNVYGFSQADETLRYPFFEELIWYTLARYVDVLSGRYHLVQPVHDFPSSSPTTSHRHISKDYALSALEITGIQAMVIYLSQASKKIAPRFVARPRELLLDVRYLIVDKQQQGGTSSNGSPVLVWVGENFESPNLNDDSVSERLEVKRERRKNKALKKTAAPKPHLAKKTKKKTAKKRHHQPDVGRCVKRNKAKMRVRKVRCGRCDGCLSSDCGQCTNCLDMFKFGGLGSRKKACVQRWCRLIKRP
jgi:hypothetical protein